ncbi:MAG TPA: hypothetical protein GX513_06435 [Firmicutes bacterium]|nr:hypothetical protein [Bacillota bacterium]
MKLLLTFHLDRKGRPTGETVMAMGPGPVMLDRQTAESLADGYGTAQGGGLPFASLYGDTLPIAGLLAEFLATPATPEKTKAFLARWGMQSIYPWQDDRNRRVGPDHPHAVIGWRNEQEALRDCVRRWLLPGDRPPVERFAQNRWLPAVRDGAKVRLARLSLEPDTAFRCTPWQFKLAWGRIRRGQAADLSAHIKAFSWRYWTEDVLALAWLELFTCVQYGIALRACPLCGDYFASDGTKAQYCPACRAPEGKAKRQSRARQGRPEEEKERARAWNRARMKAVRHAHEGDWQPALELVERAAKDPLLSVRIRALKRGSETYRVLEKAGEKLLNRAEINLSTFHRLFPQGWAEGRYGAGKRGHAVTENVTETRRE